MPKTRKDQDQSILSIYTYIDATGVVLSFLKNTFNNQINVPTVVFFHHFHIKQKLV